MGRGRLIVTFLFVCTGVAALFVLVLLFDPDLSVNATMAELLLVVVLGLEGLLAASELRAQRSGNFIEAWQNITDRLHQPDLRLGRSVLRGLHRAGVQPANPEQWPTSGFQTLDPKTPVETARNAFDAFDLAATMVLHSGIPDLTSVLVAEYQDSIIACWEQGVSFFTQRVLELQPQGEPPAAHYARGDLYQCFSVLYVMAKHHRNARPTTYPFYSFRDRKAIERSTKHWEQRARAERERLIASALDRRLS
jgi:hypothetical protein